MPCRRLWYETWYCTPESDPCITICWGLSSVSMICLCAKGGKKTESPHNHPDVWIHNLWAYAIYLRNRYVKPSPSDTKAWMRTHTPDRCKYFYLWCIKKIFYHNKRLKSLLLLLESLNIIVGLSCCSPNRRIGDRRTFFPNIVKGFLPVKGRSCTLIMNRCSCTSCFGICNDHESALLFGVAYKMALG